MRNWFIGLSVVLFVTGPVVAADDAATAVVKKAIEAHGGAEALNKYPAGTSKFKGTLTVLEMDLDYTGEIIYQLPDKFNLEITTSVQGNKIAIQQIANGKKIKQTVNGEEKKMSEAEKADLLQSVMLQEIEGLTPLLDGKKYTIKAEKDGAVDGNPAAVILVTAKGLNDTKLYFDKKTMLLVKTERKGLGPGKGEDNVEVLEETYMSDFKKVQGVMTAMKVKVDHDGKKFMTMDTTEVKLLEKADPKKFALID
jgi:hypothetical protein